MPFTSATFCKLLLSSSVNLLISASFKLNPDLWNPGSSIYRLRRRSTWPAANQFWTVDLKSQDSRPGEKISLPLPCNSEPEMMPPTLHKLPTPVPKGSPMKRADTGSGPCYSPALQLYLQRKWWLICHFWCSTRAHKDGTARTRAGSERDRYGVSQKQAGAQIPGVKGLRTLADESQGY
ncbi:hypothetical protein DFH09DRAFT_1089516 [Mycena vulgaris]|nr:hypothetical protein DFH09DRAFT_1089516 [Mycena vulgaris]